MAAAHGRHSRRGQWWRVGQVLCLGLVLCVTGCETSGDIDDLAPLGSSGQAVEAESVQNLLTLYSEAFRNEDIDRLQSILSPIAASLAQPQPHLVGSMAMLSPDAFRQQVREAFMTLSIGDMNISGTDMALAAEPPSVLFWEVLSVEDASDSAGIEQQTRVSRTTFQLARRQDESASDVTAVLITAVRQEPLVRIALSGQIQPEAPTSVEVHSLEPSFALDELEIKAMAPGEIPQDKNCMTMPGASVAIETIEPMAHFRGVFTSPGISGIHFLCVRVRSGADNVVFLHPYRLPVPDVTVEAIDVLDKAELEGCNMPLFGVAVRQNGDVWFGGEGRQVESGSVGTYIVLSEQGTVRECEEIGVPFWEDNPFVSSRIKAIAFDDSERPHLLFSAENRRGDVIAHGILVDNGSALCQTVNVLDPNYPFKVLNLNDNTRPQRPSPSADVIAAGGNDIWLFGSDGGVARVVDEVGQGLCPDVIPITYAPVMRRQDGAEDNRLLTNTVPALVPSAADGVLWWGTFLGLQRLQDGQFTTIPFDRAPTVNVSQADTLEGLFREVAQAIFEAQPLTTVAVGDISLAAIFDTSAFVKEDFVFSAVEDARGRLWVGTLGGGMRRVEACDGKWRDTLHLTRTQMVIAPCEGERRRIRQEGDQRHRVFLGSNIILALAVGQNDTIWAVTTEGVSHIREDDAEVTVTNITALEGLTASIVRDVAIGQDGTVWLATNIGPFRIIPREN